MNTNRGYISSFGLLNDLELGADSLQLRALIHKYFSINQLLNLLTH